MIIVFNSDNSFNSSKTKAVYFSNKPNTVTPTLKFQGCDLEFVPTHKHLSVIFFEDLSWSSYINSSIANAQKKLGLMKNLKFKLNRKSLSLLYNSFIRPQLEYASDVWGGCSITDSDK